MLGHLLCSLTSRLCLRAIYDLAVENMGATAERLLYFLRVDWRLNYVHFTGDEEHSAHRSS